MHTWTVVGHFNHLVEEKSNLVEIFTGFYFVGNFWDMFLGYLKSTDFFYSLVKYLAKVFFLRFVSLSNFFFKSLSLMGKKSIIFSINYLHQMTTWGEYNAFLLVKNCFKMIKWFMLCYLFAFMVSLQIPQNYSFSFLSKTKFVFRQLFE